MGLQGRALAADRVAAQGQDGGEVAQEVGRGRRPDLVHLLVDAGAPVARLAVPAARDVDGDLVALVGEGVGQEIACWFSWARVTRCCESVRSDEAASTAGVPAAMAVIPTTATPATSRLRTRTRRPPSARSVGAASEPLLLPPLLRGRFFCTGARNLDSSALEAEVTHGHMNERPAPWYGFRPFQCFSGGGAHQPLRHTNE